MGKRFFLKISLATRVAEGREPPREDVLLRGLGDSRKEEGRPGNDLAARGHFQGNPILWYAAQRGAHWSRFITMNAVPATREVSLENCYAQVD